MSLIKEPVSLQGEMVRRQLLSIVRTTKAIRILVTLAGSVLLAANCQAADRSLGAGATRSGNLLANGGFEEAGEGTAASARGWDSAGGPRFVARNAATVDAKVPAQEVVADQACLISDETPHAGKRCALIQRNGTESDYFAWRQKGIPLEPGALYRLRFWVKADARARELLGVCFTATGPEGPAWPIRPVPIKAEMQWQQVEVLFRAQFGFNPLTKTDLEFRLQQWRPGRAEEKTPQRCWLDDVSFERIDGAELANAPVVRWLLVPNRPGLRYADIELALGDGVDAEDTSVEFYRDGVAMRRVPFHDQLQTANEFAFSGRTRRVYVNESAAHGDCELRFRPRINPEAGAYLNMTQAGASRALRVGKTGVERIPLEISEPGDITRSNWPVTQGLPFPRGLLADISEIRVLDPAGQEIPAQVRATSFWEDDSVRWALLDFSVNVQGGQKTTYQVECGQGVKRAGVERPLGVKEDADSIHVNTGPLQFTVSKTHFRLFEDVVLDGKKALDGSPTIQVIEDTGKRFTTSGEKPYVVAVEEAGPLRAVIAVMGWNTDEKGERFLTYTTRIHAYQGQRFVRVFHTLTDRHKDNVMGHHKVADQGWPIENPNISYRDILLPGRNVADCSVILPMTSAKHWEIAVNGGSPLSGDLQGGPVVHRQSQRIKGSGLLTAPNSSVKTDPLPGSVTLMGPEASVTAAVYRYADLFPKELRVSDKGLELGLMPFSKAEPHAILKGTARTTEMLFAFEPANSPEGAQLARAFAEPLVLANPAWYCASAGFLDDLLLPENDKTIGTYDLIVSNFVGDLKAPLGPGYDDCGLANYGDFLYGGYNRWVNLEYDSDLGLFIHFARAGDRFAYLFGQDSSRHFLDSDTGWYTGDFFTHGANFPHEFAHYDPHAPSGHTYTVGLMHYYLLTGDRRGLEATRYNADACFRAFYFSVKAWGSLYDAKDPVAVPRRQFVNDRHRSDPSRYPMHTYQVTAEPRFLETPLAVANELAKMPKGWFGHDDEYLHYRWPLVLHYLVQVTGRQDLKQLLIDCGDWHYDDSYSRYGEYRAVQCGAGVVSTGNNTRMMFQTVYAYELTGKRKYLDWLMNMYDGEIEAYRNKIPTGLGGKGFGKFGDNPARALTYIVPNRTVLVAPSPARFSVRPPGKGIWQIALRNTSETPVEGTLEIGPLPPGVNMETKRAFALAIKEEKQFEFPVEFTDAIAEGRTTVPYSVYTRSSERKGERHGFFAVHALRPLTEKLPELLFHATLDGAGPAESALGSGTAVIEKAAFMPGKFGQAMGPATRAISFEQANNVRAEQGTLLVWIRMPARIPNDELLELWGYGNWFLGVRTRNLMLSGTRFPLRFSEPTIDRWHHLAITWDLDEYRVYVDGQPMALAGKKGSSSPTFRREMLEIPTTGKLQLLSAPGCGLDDLRIYSIVLSHERVKELCKDLKPGQPGPDSMSRGGVEEQESEQ